MGYDQFSKNTLAALKIDKPDRIDKILDKMGGDKTAAIKGLLDLHRIVPDNLADYVGDIQAAKMLIGDLVRARCLVRYEKQSWYMKNPAFSSWLKEYKRKKGY